MKLQYDIHKNFKWDDDGSMEAACYDLADIFGDVKVTNHHELDASCIKLHISEDAVKEVLTYLGAQINKLLHTVCDHVEEAHAAAVYMYGYARLMKDITQYIIDTQVVMPEEDYNERI